MKRNRFVLLATLLSCLLMGLVTVPPAHAQGRPDLVWMRGGSGGPPVYSPDGKYLVSSNGSLQIRRVSDGLLLRDITLPAINGVANTIYTPAVSPDNQYIAAGSSDKSVRKWRIADGQQVLTFQSFASAAIGTVAFSPDGRFLAGGSSDWGVYIWNASTGAQVRGIHDLPGAVKQVAFTPNGQYLAASAVGGSYIYSVSDWQHVSVLLPGVAFDISPDSQTIAFQLTIDSGATFQVRLYNIPDGSNRGTIGSANGSNGVRFSPDGRRIAQGLSSSVGIWNLSDGTAVSTINLSNTLPSYGTGFPSFAFAPNSQTLTTADATGAIQEWRVSDGAPIRTFTEIPGPAEHITASPDGKLLAEVHNVNAHTLVVRRATDGAVLQTFNYTNTSQNYSPIYSTVFSPDSKYLAIGRAYDTGGRVLVYKVSDWSSITLPIGTGAIYAVAFSPDGNYIAGVGNDFSGQNGVVSLWHLPDFTTCGSFGTPGSGGIAFSPDSHLLAVELYNGNIQFYNPENCQYVSGFNTPGNTFGNPIFTSDGQAILQANGNGVGGDGVSIWKVADGTLLRTIHHGQPVSSIALSPDGQFLATCGGTALKFWLVQDNSPLPLLTYDQEINNSSIAYSADGQYLYHGRADGSVWQALNPYRNTVLPNHGGNTGNVTFKCILSGNFTPADGVQVKLVASGQPDIIAQNVTVINLHLLQGTFNLNGATLGMRDVVITNTDGTTRTYPMGFKVEQTTSQKLRSEVLGSTTIRGGKPQTFQIHVTNPNNINIESATVWVAFSQYMNWKIGNGETGFDWTQDVNEVTIPWKVTSIQASGSLNIPLTLTAADDPQNAHRPFRIHTWITLK